MMWPASSRTVTVSCEARIDAISIACTDEHKCHDQEKAIAEIGGVIY
jgi:hypothetical protein